MWNTLKNVAATAGSLVVEQGQGLLDKLVSGSRSTPVVSPGPLVTRVRTFHTQDEVAGGEHDDEEDDEEFDEEEFDDEEEGEEGGEEEVEENDGKDAHGKEGRAGELAEELEGGAVRNGDAHGAAAISEEGEAAEDQIALVAGKLFGDLSASAHTVQRNQPSLRSRLYSPASCIDAPRVAATLSALRRDLAAAHRVARNEKRKRKRSEEDLRRAAEAAEAAEADKVSLLEQFQGERKALEERQSLELVGLQETMQAERANFRAMGDDNENRLRAMTEALRVLEVSGWGEASFRPSLYPLPSGLNSCLA